MIFDSRTAHGSGRNEGVLRRVGLTMIYSPAAVHLTDRFGGVRGTPVRGTEVRWFVILYR